MMRPSSFFASTPPASSIVAIATGAVVADAAVMALNFSGRFFHSERLTEWYTTYQLSAVLGDVLIIVLATLLGNEISARLHWKSPLWLRILAVLGVQVAHDFAFYLANDRVVPRGLPIFDLLKDYADEVGAKAIVGDGMMMLCTLGVAEVVGRGSSRTQAVALMTSVYAMLYVLHSRPRA